MPEEIKRKRNRFARRRHKRLLSEENDAVASREIDNETTSVAQVLAAEPAADTTAYNIEVAISGDVQAGNPLMAMMVGLPTEVSFDASATGEVTVVTEALEEAVDENVVVDVPLVSSILGLSPQDTLADLSSLIAESVAEIELDVTTPTGDTLIAIAPAPDGELSITFPSEGPIAGILDGVEIPDVGDITLEDAAEALGNLFDIELTGGNGTVTAETDITGFDFSFDNQTNSLELNVADPDVLSDAIDTGAIVTASGEVTVSLDLSEIDSSLDILGIEMPPILSGGMSLLESLGIDEVTLGSGSFELQATIEPVSDTVV
ncbi:MAG: hypothetical protein AB4352_01930 [Hormoscilla sp.]